MSHYWQACCLPPPPLVVTLNKAQGCWNIHCVLWKHLSNMTWLGMLFREVIAMYRQRNSSNTSPLSAGFPVLYGMLADWLCVETEGAWWNTNPYRSMRSRSLCPLSLGSMVAAGNATSVHKTTAPGWDNTFDYSAQHVNAVFLSVKLSPYSQMIVQILRTKRRKK